MTLSSFVFINATTDSRAYAGVDGSNIPDFVEVALWGACNNSGYNAAQGSWVSLANQPLSTSTTVGSNTPTELALQWNIVAMQCPNRPVNTIFLTSYRVESTSPSISALNGQVVAVSYQDTHWNLPRATPYSVASIPFNHTVSLASTTSVPITVVDKKINIFSGGTIGCVRRYDPNIPPDNRPRDAYDFGACNTYGSATANLDVFVTPPDVPPLPAISAENRCEGVVGFTNGASVDIYGPAGIIGSAPSGSLISLAGRVSPGTSVDVYGIGDNVSTRGNAVMSIAWNPPDSCERDIEVIVDATISGMDPEDPRSATFDSGVRLASGAPVNGINVTRRYYIKRAAEHVFREVSGGVTVSTTGVNDLLSNVDLSPYSLVAGDEVCAYILASPARGRATQGGALLPGGTGVVEDEYCEKISNKPFLSFYGGDVMAGGDFAGGNCLKSSRIAAYNNLANLGSGVQFAATALGSVQGFTSSRLTTGTPAGLTFANSPGPLGGFGSQICIPDYFSSKGTLSATPAVSNIDLSSSPLAEQTFIQNNLILGGNLPDSLSRTLYVEGDLRITSNIDYVNTTGWTNVEQIPSLYVFVKGNIFIDPAVTKVTGFFVSQPKDDGTGGLINTCAVGSTPIDLNDLYNSDCRSKLTIQGSFAASRVRFSRVAGSMREATGITESASAESMAGEVFQFTPNMYLAPATASPDRSDLKGAYDYFTALPPIL